MPPKTTLWPLDPHTKGKHRVLKHYLDAWLPIMSSTSRNERILFIDGFCGPGQYEGGEDGSPILAMKAVRDHHAKHTFRSKIIFIFVDTDERRLEHLKALVAPLQAELGDLVEVFYYEYAFDISIGGIVQGMHLRGEQLAPALVMVDPFGVSDTPMTVIGDILQHPKSEVYVSVMWDFIERFHQTKEFPPHLDELFGTTDWRAAMTKPTWIERKRSLFDLYKRQLKKVGGATNVVHVELYEGTRLVYAIFHATKSSVGCDRMKAAIWKVAANDGVAFRPGSESIGDLFADDRSHLQSQLAVRFGDGKWYDVDRLEEWIMTDDTIYHKSQLRSALKEMEPAGRLEVRAAAGKKRRPLTYPSGTFLRFPASS